MARKYSTEFAEELIKKIQLAEDDDKKKEKEKELAEEEKEKKADKESEKELAEKEDDDKEDKKFAARFAEHVKNFAEEAKEMNGRVCALEESMTKNTEAMGKVLEYFEKKK